MSGADGSGGGGSSSLQQAKTNSLSDIFTNPVDARMAVQRFGDGDGLNNEIMRETGFAREKDAFDLRLKALTDPKEYRDERDKALRDVGRSVQEAYTNTYKLYRQSGESDEKARDAAKSAGMKAKELQMKQFHVRFPDADVQIYKQQSVREAKAFAR